MKDRKVDVVTDLDGSKIVFIHDIRFKGKRAVNWKDVEEYLKQYVGDFFEIAETSDIIYIGSDLPDEYTHSNYTIHLKGAVGKAKANATQGLPELIKIARRKAFENNRKKKHDRNARKGWYKYESKFALAVFDDNGEVDHYNVFNVRLVVRHDADDKMYLYDIIEIKKRNEQALSGQ